jgi:hypothetical protein
MNTIPANFFSGVQPGVLAVAGNPLSLNGVILTPDPSIPIGTVQGFADDTAVEDWFGAESPEAVEAGSYFGGYTNGNSLPSQLWFVQYNSAAVSAYLRGATVAALSLSALQALSGTLALSIDGMAVTSAEITLAGATSYSNAAALIQTGLQTSGGIFSGTATLVDASPTMTVVSTVSGQIYVGMPITGTDIPAGTTVLSFGTYTPLVGTGTVTLSANATATVAVAEAVDGQTAATVTYDSLRQAFVITSATTGTTSSIGYPAAGALSTGLNLTQATGAVISPGAAAPTPAQLMNMVAGVTQNWATFMTRDMQVLSVQEEFAAWTAAQNNRYGFVCQDNNPEAITSNATGTFGYISWYEEEYSGTMAVYDSTTGGTGTPSAVAAFVMGFTASINFELAGGRATIAFKNQAGLSADPNMGGGTVGNGGTNFINACGDPRVPTSFGNGYNAYVATATATQEFTWFQRGMVAGEFVWWDSYINQIYLNASLQSAMLTLEAAAPSMPYAIQGYNLIRSAVAPIAAQGLAFGSITVGVALSQTQQTEINLATGDAGAAAAIINNGWYLQVLDPGSTVRGGRGSPQIKFYYADGGSIQCIQMSSTEVQ